MSKLAHSNQETMDEIERQAREDEALPGVWLAEIDVMSGIEFEKYVAAAMRVGPGAGTDPKRSLSSDSTDPT